MNEAATVAITGSGNIGTDPRAGPVRDFWGGLTGRSCRFPEDLSFYPSCRARTL